MRGSLGEETSFAESGFFLDEDVADGAARATQQALIDTQERMGMMLDIMPMGLLIHTRQGILFANREACRMLDAACEELVGQHLLDFVAGPDVDRVLRQINDSFHDASAMQKQETLILSRGGAATNIKLISSRLPWRGTPVIQILLQDVSDLKKNELRLQRLSITDELTGAFNRRHVFSEARRQMRIAAEEGFPLSVVLMDIDHFKRINDTFGHAAGDLALVDLTRTLTRLLHEEAGGEAVFSRLGGEEFLALLPGMDADEASVLAERMRQAVAALRVDGPRGGFGFTMSLGVATTDAAGGATFDNLVSRADGALYKAKSGGRDRMVRAA